MTRLPAPLATTKLSLGIVTFEVDRVERMFGHDYVYCWITTSGLRRSGDAHVENGGNLVMVSREAWESMVETVRQAKEEAA